MKNYTQHSRENRSSRSCLSREDIYYVTMDVSVFNHPGFNALRKFQRCHVWAVNKQLHPAVAFSCLED